MDMKSYLTPEEFHHRKIKFVSLRHQIPLRLWAISANVGAAAAALLAARYYSVKCSKVDLENCQFQKKVPQKLWFSLLRWVIRSCLRSNVNKKITFFLCGQMDKDDARRPITDFLETFTVSRDSWSRRSTGFLWPRQLETTKQQLPDTTSERNFLNSTNQNTGPQRRASRSSTSTD